MSENLNSKEVKAYDLVVSIGTDHHRFDRIVGWVDSYLEMHPELTCLFQHGFTDAPKNAETVARMPRVELLEFYRSARVVLVQGGPGSILDAREVGVIPISVPRVAELDEVVDNHQVEFSKVMQSYGETFMVQDQEALFAMLDRAFADPSIVHGEVRLPQADTASENLARELEAMPAKTHVHDVKKFVRRASQIAMGIVGPKLRK